MLQQIELWAADNEIGLRSQQFAGHTIHYLNPPDNEIPATPAWCVTESHIVLALYPQTIRAFLARGDDYQSLATRPQVARLLQSEAPPVKLFYQDTPTLFRLIYPLVQVVASLASADLRQELREHAIAHLQSPPCIVVQTVPIAVHKTVGSLPSDAAEIDVKASKAVANRARDVVRQPTRRHGYARCHDGLDFQRSLPTPASLNQR